MSDSEPFLPFDTCEIIDIVGEIESPTTSVCTDYTPAIMFHSGSLPVLPFDITSQIIDFVGETEDKTLLKSLALVSPSFHQISSKYLFASIELQDAKRHIPSSKKGFAKLLESRPDVVKHIRKLTYHLKNVNNADHLVAPVLSYFLPSTSCLNYLGITNINTRVSTMEWNKLDPSLTSGLLRLMHLPTMNHIDLSFFQNFPISSLASSVNLHRLDVSCMTHFDPHDSEEDDSFEIVQSETAPKLREFHTLMSSLLTTKLLNTKRQDGRPAFDFTDLKQLSMQLENESKFRYLMQSAESLETLHLKLERDIDRYSLSKFHDILSLRSSTLKVLDLTVYLNTLADLCEELEAMGGDNILEALSFNVHIEDLETEDYIGSRVQEVEKVLVRPGWSALRQVSIKIRISCGSKEVKARLVEELQSLPGKYLSHLSKLESVAFNYSVVRGYTG